jgi:cysteine desulfurase
MITYTGAGNNVLAEPLLLAYLDSCATTLVEPEVLEVLIKVLRDGYGNAGSRTHEFGVKAKRVVESAAVQVAAVVGCEPDEVVFTSGATESNNIALLGLAEEATRVGRRHILSTQIEHKAVLEPLERLAKQGFEIELLPPRSNGAVDVEDLMGRVRPDTFLVSVMHVNNETGMKQPVGALAERLRDESLVLHVDAAQGFGKSSSELRHPRIDLLSVSGHKVHAPQGIGALISRKRTFKRLPLAPLFMGGGQQRGVRPGTLPVALIAALGEAAALAERDETQRSAQCKSIREKALAAFRHLPMALNGEEGATLPHVLNVSFSGVDSEAVMLSWKDLAAVSNGSACTSSSYTLSHVLRAMRLPSDRIAGAVRISWSHQTGEVAWDEMARRVASLLPSKVT